MMTLPLQTGDKVKWSTNFGIVLEDLGEKVIILIGNVMEDNEVTIEKRTLTLIF